MEFNTQNLTAKLCRLGDDEWVAAAVQALEAGGQTAKETFFFYQDDNRAIALIANLKRQQSAVAGASSSAAGSGCTARTLLLSAFPTPRGGADGGLPPSNLGRCYEGPSNSSGVSPDDVLDWDEWQPGQTLSAAICAHVEQADNMTPMFDPLPRSVQPVCGGKNKQFAVQNMLAVHQIDRLNGLLAAPGYAPQCQIGLPQWSLEKRMNLDVLVQQVQQAQLGQEGDEAQQGVGAAEAASASAAALSSTEAAAGSPAGGSGRPTRPAAAAAMVMMATVVRDEGEPAEPSGSSGNSSYVRSDFGLLFEHGMPLQAPQQQQDSDVGAAASCMDGGSTSAAAPLSAWMEKLQRFVAVGEVKRVEKLWQQGQPLELPRLWRLAKAAAAGGADEAAASVWYMLQQLYTYLVVTGSEFGWLSCYYATWLVRRPLERPSQLLLSGPFLSNTKGGALPLSGAVPAMAALSWMQRVALQHSLDGIRHAISLDGLQRGGAGRPAPLPPPSPPPPQDGGGAQNPDDERKDPTFHPKQKARRGESGWRNRPEGGDVAHVQHQVLVPVVPAGALVLGDIIGEGVSSLVLQGLCGGQHAAIKVLGCEGAAAMAHRGAAMYQVLPEAQAAGAIPTLFGVGALPLGTPFVAMSRVEGTPLSELSSVSPEVRAAAFRSLDQLHAAGVAHGDLHRSNVLVERLHDEHSPPSGSDSAEGATSLCGSPDDGSIAAMNVDSPRATGPRRPGDEASRVGVGRGAAARPTAVGPARVVLVDLGRARAGASPAVLAAEKQRLSFLLQ